MNSKNLIRLGDAALFATLLLCAVIVISALYYHGSRLEREVIESHQRLVEVEARHALDHFVHTLGAANMTLQSLPALEHLLDPRSSPDSLFASALTRQPHLRSLSVVSAEGEVLVSSNPDNVGHKLDLSGFLPGEQAPSDLLRFGPAYEGRDLNDGKRIVDRSASTVTMTFFPVLHKVARAGPDTRDYRLLATINVDYFLNRLTLNPPLGLDRVEILRYDGSLLLTSRTGTYSAADLDANERIASAWRSGAIRGADEESIANEGDYITAWRVASTLPIAVISRLDRAIVVAEARAEIRKQQLFMFPLMMLGLASILTLHQVFRRAQQQQQRLAQEQQESARLSRLLDALPANILLFAENGAAQITNRSWQNFASRHGFATDDPHQALHYRTLDRWLTPCASNHTMISLGQGIETVLHGHSKVFDGEFSFDTGSGQRWLHIIVRPFIHDQSPGVAVMQLDITDRRRAEEGMELRDAALKATATAIVITDVNAVIEWANPAFTRLTGYSLGEVIGRNAKELVGSGKQDATFYADMWATILNGTIWHGELINKHKSGVLYHESMTITPVIGADGKPRHFVAVKEDITQRKQQETELLQQATTDPLTGIMNRRAIIDNMALELRRIKRHDQCSVFLMIDLDYFKRINDEHGHAVGDLVLKHFCNLATTVLRKTDILGRIGGEEFGVLLDQTGLKGGAELAERLRSAIEASTLQADSVSVSITASIGVTTLLASDESPDEVLLRADQALYRAKTNGRNRVEFQTELPSLAG